MPLCYASVCIKWRSSLGNPWLFSTPTLCGWLVLCIISTKGSNRSLLIILSLIQNTDWNLWEPIQTGVSPRSADLKTAYLEALLYYKFTNSCKVKKYSYHFAQKYAVATKQNVILFVILFVNTPSPHITRICVTQFPLAR